MRWLYNKESTLCVPRMEFAHFSRNSDLSNPHPLVTSLHPPHLCRIAVFSTRASALDLGGARWGGMIKLGLSEYVICDHFGFVYVLALEECDRVVAA